LTYALYKLSMSPFLLSPFLLGGCGSATERPTPAEWVKENTLIISQLASYRGEEQQAGVARFLALGKEQGSEVVLYFLDDPAVARDERVVVILARILSIWKDPRGVSYLLDSLANSRDDGVVRIAEEGLAEYGENVRILNRLEETAAAGGTEARRASVSLLSRMKDPRALEILGSRLRGEPEVEVRAVCLFGILDADPSPGRTDGLIDALTDPDAEIRALAWAALERDARAPRGFDPWAELAARSRAISDLRRWARDGR
jgi:HEAT repeat protein